MKSGRRNTGCVRADGDRKFPLTIPQHVPLLLLLVITNHGTSFVGKLINVILFYLYPGWFCDTELGNWTVCMSLKFSHNQE